MTINSINDLCAYLDTTVEDIERDVYDSTECGAWIHWTDKEVMVGSIVEGSNAEFSDTLIFPFDSSMYDDLVAEIEELCDEAWHEANDEEECK